MVNVNKPVSKDENAEKQMPKRRPRNTELNSSKKVITGALHQENQNPFKVKLNSSKESNTEITGNVNSEIYDKLYNRTNDPKELADMLGMSVEDVLAVDAETEDNGYGRTIGYLIAKPEYEEELGQNGIEILSILEDGTVGMMVGNGFHTVETDLGLVLDRIEGEEDMDSSCDSSVLNSESGSTNIKGKITLYNDFAEMNPDTYEKLIRDRVSKAVPEAKVDFDKISDTEVGISIDCKDADADKVRIAVESSDATKSVDWGSNLDSGCHDKEKLDSATEDDVKITTESGNEVSLSDIQIIQNPSTNEISLFIKEDEDEEIPEGFTVIATAAKPALSEGACPECGQDPCVCECECEEAEGEELDSSKKKESNAELNSAKDPESPFYTATDAANYFLGKDYTDEQIERYLKRRGYSDEWIHNMFDLMDEYSEEFDSSKKELDCELDKHEMLYAYLEALEDTSNDLLVKEKLFGNTDDRTLRECITDLDESESLDMVSQAIIDLMLGDEVADSMLGAYDPLDSSDIDSSLNCSISEVKVPEEFAASNDKAEDLRNIVENELQDKGFNVEVKQIVRPNATTIRVGFEGEADESEVDKSIEEIIAQLTKDSLFNS